MSPRDKPALLVVFYANPDRYPPTYNAVCLLREHFRVRVICRKSDDAPGVVWPEDVRVDRVGPGGSAAEAMAASAAAKLREYVGFTQAVRRALAEDRPRVVYAYEPHALVAAAIARARVPVVYQRHEVEELDHLPTRSLHGWILRASLPLSRRAALVVFPEKERARYYLGFSRDPRPPVIVPNFPLRATFPPVASPEETVQARLRDKVVFYRGSIGADNGIPEAIRAMAHLPEGLRLRLCGASTPRFAAEIEALAAKLGVGPRVRYEGFLPSFEALNLETTRATVGVVLYHAVHTNWQHVGSATNKLYEYAACSLPAVVPDRPTFRSFLEGEAWVEYADPTDPEDVARAVLRIVEDDARYAARCGAARSAFEERFNYEAVFAPLQAKVLALAGV